MITIPFELQPNETRVIEFNYVPAFVMITVNAGAVGFNFGTPGQTARITLNATTNLKLHNDGGWQKCTLAELVGFSADGYLLLLDFENEASVGATTTNPLTRAPGGELIIAGNVQITGSLLVQQATTLQGQLTVQAAARFNAAVTMNSTLDVGSTILGYSSLVLAGGNLTLSAPAQRIRGDFSNPTRANRTLFQDRSTGSAPSYVGVIPAGAGGGSGFTAYSTSNPDSCSIVEMVIDNSAALAYLQTWGTGTASAFPLVFRVGGTEGLRVQTDGRVTTANRLEIAPGAGATRFQALRLTDDASFVDPQDGWYEFRNAADTAWGNLKVGDIAVNGFGYIYGRIAQMFHWTADADTTLTGVSPWTTVINQSFSMATNSQLIAFVGARIRNTQSVATLGGIRLSYQGFVQRELSFATGYSGMPASIAFPHMVGVGAGNVTVTVDVQAQTAGYQTIFSHVNIVLLVVNMQTG